MHAPARSPLQGQHAYAPRACLQLRTPGAPIDSRPTSRQEAKKPPRGAPTVHRSSSGSGGGTAAAGGGARGRESPAAQGDGGADLSLLGDVRRRVHALKARAQPPGPVPAAQAARRPPSRELQGAPRPAGLPPRPNSRQGAGSGSTGLPPPYPHGSAWDRPPSRDTRPEAGVLARSNSSAGGAAEGAQQGDVLTAASGWPPRPPAPASRDKRPPSSSRSGGGGGGGPGPRPGSGMERQRRQAAHAKTRAMLAAGMKAPACRAWSAPRSARCAKRPHGCVS